MDEGGARSIPGGELLHLPASRVPRGTKLEFDVCVVGAGPAGLTLAAELGRTGMRVGVVESGAFARPPDRDGRSRGEIRGMPYFDLRRARARAVGGSSWRWLEEAPFWSVDGGLRCRPLEPADFRARAHVPGSGWPIAPEALAPYYERAHALLGLAAANYEAGYWAGGAPTGPLDLGPGVQTTICQFAPPSTFIDVGSQLASSATVTLVTGGSVIDLAPSAGMARIEEALVATAVGGHFRIAARWFVVAGGGIENARLLLCSPATRAGGPANQFDLVGRCFMEHVHVESGVFRPAPSIGIDRLGFYRRQLVRNTPILGALQIPDRLRDELGLLNSIVTFIPREEVFLRPAVRAFAELRWSARERSRPAATQALLRTVAASPIDVARAALRTGRRSRSPRAATLVTTAEQAPNPASRVTLGKAKDRFGIPQPRLEWHLTPLDYQSLRRTQDALDAAMLAAGLGAIQEKWGDVEPAPRIHGCWHHMGTTRMGTDARSAVVDPDCRVHGLQNLFVAGSSVFPTAGATTVTLTIAAMALRLADHIASVASPPPLRLS
jgi:choline dehydrogenase-like flavoprotein